MDRKRTAVNGTEKVGLWLEREAERDTMTLYAGPVFVFSWISDRAKGYLPV